MKNEIMKTKSFDIALFETLDSKGTTLLKGGFSTVYDENLACGGFPGLDIKVTVNTSPNCGCTNSCNTVVGCGCATSQPPAK